MISRILSMISSEGEQASVVMKFAKSRRFASTNASTVTSKVFEPPLRVNSSNLTAKHFRLPNIESWTSFQVDKARANISQDLRLQTPHFIQRA